MNHTSLAQRIWMLGLLSALSLSLFTAPVGGQDNSASAPRDALLSTSAPAPPLKVSLWGTIHHGGVIGYLIVLLSVIAGGLVIEHFWTIRRDTFVPERLVAGLKQDIDAKRYEEAQRKCSDDRSFLAVVVAAGLNEMESMFRYFDMQNAMQEISEREISRLYRKLEYLAFIAATAPMLGLLGTVTGMIRSFNIIAVTEGAATPSQLAGGISEALVTTCMGLIVAIPTMFFVSLFRNRIDGYVAETESVVEKLMNRFRRESAT